MIRRPGLARGRTPGLGYAESKRRAQDEDAQVRADLATRHDAPPEILYYLAEDQDPRVRSRVAANPETPIKANELLVGDPDEEVRFELARKIARLLPDLDGEALERLRDRTIEILEGLAQDQLPRVRRLVAEELAHSASAPRHLIQRLARDPEFVVAAPILEYSVLLSDEELVEIIRSGAEEPRLEAIARRPAVSRRVSDAIVETWKEGAIRELLANPSAQIREEALDHIIDRAADRESWHEPLVRRPELPLRAIHRIAGFVASSLLETLTARREIDPETAAEIAAKVQKRVRDELVEDDATARERARALHAEGRLDEETVRKAIDEGERAFVIEALALRAAQPRPLVERIMASGSGKAVTALTWKAGLPMRTALKLQTTLAHVPRASFVSARGGVEYPMAEDELAWHLEYFTG